MFKVQTSNQICALLFLFFRSLSVSFLYNLNPSVTPRQGGYASLYMHPSASHVPIVTLGVEGKFEYMSCSGFILCCLALGYSGVFHHQYLFLYRSSNVHYDMLDNFIFTLSPASGRRSVGCRSVVSWSVGRSSVGRRSVVVRGRRSVVGGRRAVVGGLLVILRACHLQVLLELCRVARMMLQSCQSEVEDVNIVKQ